MCETFSVFSTTFFLHFALSWPLHSEQRSLSGSGATWVFSSQEKSALQVALLWKLQISQIHLVYMLCPIISSARRNFSNILFPQDYTSQCRLFSVFFFKVIVAFGIGTQWSDYSVYSNLLYVRSAIFLQCIYLSDGTWNTGWFFFKEKKGSLF